MRVALTFIAACRLLSTPVAAQPFAVPEASGIARSGDDLIIVDDGQPGVYFRYRMQAGERGPLIRLDPDRMERVPLPKADFATDLESIDVLADGRVVVLSERLRALFSSDGVVAEYDSFLSEFGKRGLEGLAVDRSNNGVSRVAVLWEGGYPEYEHVPPQLQRRVGRLAMRPVLQLHRIESGDERISVRGRGIELQTPLPRGRAPRAQRFRAPDLVWNKRGDGSSELIVLLSSFNSSGDRKYEHHWLQRFALNGETVGGPVDLDQVMPPALAGRNWEGLGWFEPGRSLVLVHESFPRATPTAFVLPLPDEWSRPQASDVRLTQGAEPAGAPVVKSQ